MFQVKWQFGNVNNIVRSHYFFPRVNARRGVIWLKRGVMRAFVLTAYTHFPLVNRRELPGELNTFVQLAISILTPGWAREKRK